MSHIQLIPAAEARQLIGVKKISHYITTANLAIREAIAEKKNYCALYDLPKDIAPQIIAELTEAGYTCKPPVDRPADAILTHILIEF